MKNYLRRASYFFKGLLPYPKTNLTFKFSKPPEDTAVIKISAVGDITLAHRFTEFVTKNESKIFNPFMNVMDIFENSICVVNLENPLTDSSDIVKKQFNLKGTLST